MKAADKNDRNVCNREENVLHLMQDQATSNIEMNVSSDAYCVLPALRKISSNRIY